MDFKMLVSGFKNSYFTLILKSNNEAETFSTHVELQTHHSDQIQPKDRDYFFI